MEINKNIAVASGQNNYSNTKPVEKKSMGLDDFLQIMAAEMRNQNPMGGEGGGGNTDYVAQMAQFAALEQMNNISEGLELLTLMNQQQYSFSLIGKEVKLSEGEDTVIGVVDMVKLQRGYAVVVVNGKEYLLGQVLEVSETGGLIQDPPKPDPKPESEKPPVTE